MTQLLPNGKQQFTDNNGRPLVGGRVYFYSVGTQTPKDTYSDFGQTTLNTNPVILDARGSASIYGAGNYRQVLRDSLGNLIWDQVIPDLQVLIDKLAFDLSQPTGAELIGVTDYPNLQENLDAIARASFITPEKHGAVGDGVADDTDALAAAVIDAQQNGGFLFLRGWYLTTATVTQTKRLVVQGVGKHNCGVIYSGAGTAWHATTPIVGAGFTNNGWEWRGFSIQPKVDGSGYYGLRISLTKAEGGAVSFFADGAVTGMYLGDFGKEGLYLDNSVENLDGFFTSRFEYNSITNGILGYRIGDSITFAHSKVYGKNCVQISGVPGARQMILDDLNVTTHGGLFAMIEVEEFTMRDIQGEHPGYISGYTGIFGAGVVIFNCYKPLLDGCTLNPDNGAASAPVNPGLPPTCVAVTGTTSYAQIRQCDIQKGSIDHISIAQPTVINTNIDESNTFYGAIPIISDAGTGTIMPTVRGQGAYASNILAGEVQFQEISVPGARVGGFVQVAYTLGSQGLSLRGYVNAVGKVMVRIENDTLVTIALLGGNLTAKVSY